MADDLTPHVPILQPGSLMCVCGRRDNDASAHPFGLVAAATQEAGVEDHAEALWHTLWFHTLAARTRRVDHDRLVRILDRPRHLAVDLLAVGVEHWPDQHRTDADLQRLLRTVAACRDAYRRWGVDLPDDDTVIAHPTYASWRTAAASPTEEVDRG